MHRFSPLQHNKFISHQARILPALFGSFDSE